MDLMSLFHSWFRYSNSTGGRCLAAYVASGFLMYPYSVMDFRKAKSVPPGSAYERLRDFTKAEPPGSSAKQWNNRTRLQSLVVLISKPGLYSENGSLLKCR